LQGTSVKAASTDQAIRLDGILDEPAWQQAGVIADLTQQDPVPGTISFPSFRAGSAYTMVK
jgi:hypothetical protein